MKTLPILYNFIHYLNLTNRYRKCHLRSDTENFLCITTMANEAEEIVRKLALHKGVIGVIVVNGEGIPIKTTLDNHVSVQYAGLMGALVGKAKAVVRDLDPSNDLTFLRVRSKKCEVMVAPDKDFILIVVQSPME